MFDVSYLSCLTGRVTSILFKSFFHAVPMSMQQRRFVWLMIESHRTKKISSIIFHSFIHSERQYCSSYCIIGWSRRSCQTVSQTSCQYQLSIPKWILSFVHGSTYVLFYQSHPTAQNIDLSSPSCRRKSSWSGQISARQWRKSKFSNWSKTSSKN